MQKFLHFLTLHFLCLQVFSSLMLQQCVSTPAADRQMFTTLAAIYNQVKTRSRRKILTE